MRKTFTKEQHKILFEALQKNSASLKDLQQIEKGKNYNSGEENFYFKQINQKACPQTFINAKNDEIFGVKTEYPNFNTRFPAKGPQRALSNILYLKKRNKTVFPLRRENIDFINFDTRNTNFFDSKKISNTLYLAGGQPSNYLRSESTKQFSETKPTLDKNLMEFQKTQRIQSDTNLYNIKFDLMSTNNQLPSSSMKKLQEQQKYKEYQLQRTIINQEEEISQLKYQLEKLQDKQACKYHVQQNQAEYTEGQMDKSISLQSKDEQSSRLQSNKRKIFEGSFSSKGFENLLLKQEELLKNINQRSEKLKLMACFLGDNWMTGIHVKNLPNFKEALDSLAEYLQTASNLEIENNTLRDSLNQAEIKISKLEHHFKISEEKFKMMNNKLQSKQTKIQIIKEDYQKERKNYLKEKSIKEELEKKTKSLDVRLMFFCNLINKPNQKNEQQLVAVRDMLKEKEDLKNNIGQQLSEIQKKDKQISNLRFANSNLSKKIDTFKNKNSSISPQGAMQEQQLGRQDIFNDPKCFVMQLRTLPKHLNYLQSYLDYENITLLNDINLYGYQNLWTTMQSNKQQMLTVFNVLASQYSNLREFNEKLNKLNQVLISMQQITDIDELMVKFAQNMTQFYKCERAYLWIADNWTGLYKTLTEFRVSIKAIITKGHFKEVLKSGEPIIYWGNDINKKILLYEECNKIQGEISEKEVMNTILIPMISEKGEVFGIIEISNIESQSSFNYNEEYQTLLLNLFCQNQIRQINLITNLYKELKQFTIEQDVWFESLAQLCKQKNEFHFQQKINQLAEQIFNVAQSHFLFVCKTEDGSLIFKRYQSEIKCQEIDINKGVAGYIVKNPQPILFSSVSSQQQYDKNVDIDSVLPVMYSPIVKTEGLEQGQIQIIGILMLIVKQKVGLQGKSLAIQRKETFNKIGLNANIEHLAHRFSYLVLQAMEFRNKCWYGQENYKE